MHHLRIYSRLESGVCRIFDDEDNFDNQSIQLGCLWYSRAEKDLVSDPYRLPNEAAA